MHLTSAVSLRRFARRMLPPLLVALLVLTARAADDTKKSFNVPAGDAAQTLKQFAAQASREIVFAPDIVGGVTTGAVKGDLAPRAALDQMLANTGLVAGQDERTGAFAIRKGAPSPNAPRAALAKSSDRPSEKSDKPEEKALVLETFEVMGSKVLNMDVKRSRDDAQPYVIFDRAKIEQSGATSLEEFLNQRLTASTGGLTASQTAASTLGNLSQINLRGLGSSQTLILIDGHRAVSAVSVTGPAQSDLNGIPLGAIERIEVLPTTASGIYGGSATGGVINIVLRRDYVGAEVKTTYDNTFKTDSRIRTVDLSAGVTLEHGKTQLLLAAHFSDANALTEQDRDFILRGRARILTNNPANYFNAANPPMGSTTNVRSSTGVNLTLKTGTALNSPITFVPVGYSGTASDGGAALVANAGKYNFALANSAQSVDAGGRLGVTNNPTIESLTATLRRQFTPNFQAFLEATASNNLGATIYSAVTKSFALPATAPNNPFTQALQVTVPTASGDGLLRAGNFERRAVGGFILRLPAEWRAEADYTWDRDRVGFTQAPALLATAAPAVANGTLNVLRDTNAFPIDFSPYAQAGLGTTTPFKTTLKDATVRFAGPIWTLPAGVPTLVALLEHRDEIFGAAYYQASTTTVTYVPEKSQTVDSAYVESSLPVVSPQNHVAAIHRLDLQLAVRRDEYSVSGATNSVNVGAAVGRATDKQQSTNPTLGVRFAPVEDVTLRASYGTGFLPPAVNQLIPNASTTATAALTDPRRGNAVVAVPYQVTTGGNPNVRPEKSKSWSAGAIITPRFIRGLRVSLDYARIEKTDNIASVVNQTLINSEAVLPGRVIRGPAPAGDPFGVGPIIGLDSTLTNISQAFVEAYDGSVDYHRELASGAVLDVFTSATRQTHYRTQVAPSVPAVENVGIGSLGTNPLKFKATAGVTLKLRQWTLGWSARYAGSYFASTSATTILNQGNGGTVPSQTVHNVFASYRFGVAEPGRHARARGWLERTEVQIGVKDVFNTRPEVDLGDPFDYHSFFGDARMAAYYVSVKKAF